MAQKGFLVAALGETRLKTRHQEAKQAPTREINRYRQSTRVVVVVQIGRDQWPGEASALVAVAVLPMRGRENPTCAAPRDMHGVAGASGHHAVPSTSAAHGSLAPPVMTLPLTTRLGRPTATSAMGRGHGLLPPLLGGKRFTAPGGSV
jgi:hypothetical protein